jgi:hypothetical protein
MIGDWSWTWGCGWVLIALFCMLFALGVVAETTGGEHAHTRSEAD